MAEATPASAHSVAGSGGTNFKTTLRAVTPPLAGLRVAVIEGGSRIEVAYSGGKTLYVLGNANEQFLRIDRRGVFQNLNSPWTYVTKTRDGVAPPGNANPRKAPDWDKISDGRVARWHDHRVHWMGDVDPPAVRRSPERRHVIQPDWNITISDGTTTAIAHGDLVWLPGPSPAPWFLLAAALFAAMVAIGLWLRPFLPVAAAGAALIVVDMAHAYAIGFANVGSVAAQLGQTFAASIVSIPGWMIGAGGIWLLLRRRTDGFFALVFTGLIAAVVGGMADLNNLSKSQIEFALASGWARPIVATSLGLGFGVAAASALAIRRLEASRPEDPE